MRGDRLKEVREVRGISQRELSMRCQIGIKQIWRYENQESDPTTAQLVKICRELSVSADYLLGLVNTQEEQFKGEGLDGLHDEIFSLVKEKSLLSTLKAIKLLAEYAEGIESQNLRIANEEQIMEENAEIYSNDD